MTRRIMLPALVGFALVVLNCFSLDSFLFEPTRVTGRYLNEADMDTSWHVQFIIPDSLIEPVEMTSMGNKIYGMFVRSDGRQPILSDVLLIYHHGMGENSRMPSV